MWIFTAYAIFFGRIYAPHMPKISHYAHMCGNSNGAASLLQITELAIEIDSLLASHTAASSKLNPVGKSLLQHSMMPSYLKIYTKELEFMYKTKI